jgi:hypothetical protein
VGSPALARVGLCSSSRGSEPSIKLRTTLTLSDPNYRCRVESDPVAFSDPQRLPARLAASGGALGSLYCTPSILATTDLSDDAWVPGSCPWFARNRACHTLGPGTPPTSRCLSLAGAILFPLTTYWLFFVVCHGRACRPQSLEATSWPAWRPAAHCVRTWCGGTPLRRCRRRSRRSWGRGSAPAAMVPAGGAGRIGWWSRSGTAQWLDSIGAPSGYGES